MGDNEKKVLLLMGQRYGCYVVYLIISILGSTFILSEAPETFPMIFVILFWLSFILVFMIVICCVEVAIKQLIKFTKKEWKKLMDEVS